MNTDIPPQIVLVIQLMTRFGIASQHYQTLLERRLAPFDLTPLQMNVLSHLGRRRSAQKVTEIANAVDAGQPAISKMMTKFAAAGWVTLTPDTVDRRIKLARITDAGGAHLGATQRAMMPDIAQTLAAWGEEDLTRLTADLVRFTDVIQGTPKQESRTTTAAISHQTLPKT